MSKPFEKRDFQSSELDSLVQIFLLTPDDPLDTFAEIWYQLFIWSFFSSILIYSVAAIFAFRSLNKHKIARYSPLLLFLSGVLTALTMNILTSAVIASIYRAATFEMPPLYALVYGVGQVLVNIFFAYTRILATL